MPGRARHRAAVASWMFDLGDVGPLPSPRLRRRDRVARADRPAGQRRLRARGRAATAGALRALAGRLPSTGVTTFLPTPSAAAPADYRAARRRAGGRRAARRGARMPGPAPRGPAAVAGARGRPRAGAIAGAGATLDDVLDELLARGRRPRGDARARASRRARADPPAARRRRRRQPRPHRRDVRADRRRDRRRRDAGHPPLQRDVAASAPRARRGRRRADRRSRHRI